MAKRGRKVLPPEKRRTSRISACLTPAEGEAFTKLCEAVGLPVNAVLRKIVNDATARGSL